MPGAAFGLSLIHICLQVGDPLLAHPVIIAAVVRKQDVVFLLDLHGRCLPAIVVPQGAPALVVVEFIDIGQSIGEALRVADPFGVRSVSYTHLEVYKRQVKW